MKIYPNIIQFFENGTPKTMQCWPLQLIRVTTKTNNAYLPLHDIPFWKCQTKDNAMMTSAADLDDLQTKPKNAYLPLHDIPFWK